MNETSYISFNFITMIPSKALIYSSLLHYFIRKMCIGMVSVGNSSVTGKVIKSIVNI